MHTTSRPTAHQPTTPEGTPVGVDSGKARGKKDDSYVSDLEAAVSELYRSVHGITPSAANGKVRRVVLRLINVAKEDGYRTPASNRGYVLQLVEAYFQDSDPFVRDRMHPLGDLLGERLAKYRRPVGQGGAS